MALRPLVAGNWKMNGVTASVAVLEQIVVGARALSNVELIVCPPATLIASFAAAARGSGVLIGAQDCHALTSGAYTGDISAEMIKDAGAVAVIVGHSERRQYHGETDAAVRAKVLAAGRAGLVAIVCVGETGAERDAGRALEVVEFQLEGSLSDDSTGFVIAYEPVWAIGTGRTPTAGDVAGIHRLIRERLVLRYGHGGEDTRILYGGSVNPANANDLLAVENVDGALIGGASLKAAEFLTIAGIYR
jgi:triosephosphate isomerase (TIM)